MRGNLAPDLFGASVHHPWAGRAGATGHKAVGWGGFAAVVPLFFRLFSRIGSLPSRKWWGRGEIGACFGFGDLLAFVYPL